MKRFVLSLALTLSASAAFAGPLISKPEKFDFGWSPDNARISCEFTILNTGASDISLQALKPTCGCTAALFSPTDLASQKSTTVGLTFNTRGYNGQYFSKSSQLATGDAGTDLNLILMGHVNKPDPAVAPEGNGIAAFDPGAKSDTQVIKIRNTSNEDVILSLVQKSANWAAISLKSTAVKAKSSVELTVKVKGPYQELRETSATFEAKGPASLNRFTVAVRAGPPLDAMPRLAPRPRAAKTPAPMQDPLKLHGIEPRFDRP